MFLYFSPSGSIKVFTKKPFRDPLTFFKWRLAILVLVIITTSLCLI